jgi:hypothetical protein
MFIEESTVTICDPGYLQYRESPEPGVLPFERLSAVIEVKTGEWVHSRVGEKQHGCYYTNLFYHVGSYDPSTVIDLDNPTQSGFVHIKELYVDSGSMAISDANGILREFDDFGGDLSNQLYVKYGDSGIIAILLHVE